MRPPLQLVAPEPEPEDLAGMAYVSVPLRIRAKAQEIITAGRIAERICAGSFTTEDQMARLTDIVGRWGA